MDGELPIEDTAHFHRVEECAAANLFEGNKSFALQFAKVAEARARRFIGKDEAQACLYAD